jgi:acetyltransferase
MWESPCAVCETVRYVSRFTIKNGTSVLIRPIRPEDEPLLVKLHSTLSDETVYLRYFHMEKLSSRVAHERLLRKCLIDHDREIALVVDHQVEGEGADAGEHELLAIGRLTRIPGTDDAEVAVLVNDASQKQGLGAELLRCLIDWARDAKVGRIIALILPENEGMRALARRFKFHVQHSDDPSVVTAILDLPQFTAVIERME